MKMDADIEWRLGGPGKTQPPRPRTQGPRPLPYEHSPPLARFNGEGKAGKEVRDAQSPMLETPIPL